MPNIADKYRVMVDAFARLGADITDAPNDAEAKRLRLVTASALRAQLRGKTSFEKPAPALKRLNKLVPESARAELLNELDSIEAAGGIPDEALIISRRDEREMLLSGRLVDSLTGLSPRERLGPFRAHGGIDVWFDVFLATRRMEVRESGASTPVIVFTQARPPLIRRSTSTIDIKPGTVWIRGDLVDGSLPPAAYLGIKVVSGSLKIKQRATITGDVIEIGTPLKGDLQLKPAADTVTSVIGACSSSEAKVKPPGSLTFTFDSGSSTVEGTGGKAEVWRQTFRFGPLKGGWTFIERLWTIVLEYGINPQMFDAEPINDDLVHFKGNEEISSAGLGLPVVIANNPAILGEAAHSANWFLQVKKLMAQWYSPDLRLHELEGVWIGISAFGATIVAEDIAPLSPAVTHTYDLWTIAESNKRLPWRQTYKEPFSLFYRCHLVDGEHLMVQGQADMSFDRPVTTNSMPVPTPTAQGTVLLHKVDSTVTAMLGAIIEDEQSTHQFALRNALVWTSAPLFIFIRGKLLNPQRIDAGNAQLLFGVYRWAPTLPDPYVSNAFVRNTKAKQDVPQTLLIGRVSWTADDNVTVSFEGQLGSNLALGGRNVSSGKPRPARKSDNDPDAGLTQVEQDRLTFDREMAAKWRAAQSREKKDRGKRFKIAHQQNKKSLESIDNYMKEVVGPSPNLMLLDVSTNQDLLGVAVGIRLIRNATTGINVSAGNCPVSDLAVYSQVAGMRVVSLPQVQWEPVRTLDADQDIMTMGWFPTPLASASDGGATQIGARSQKLMPVIPEDALEGTFDAYRHGIPVGIRTTFPFGLVGAIQLQPEDTSERDADLYELTRPQFPDDQSVGGIQVTAKAEGGRPDNGGVSPMFKGQMRQLLNGVDLSSGVPLSISVLGETLQPAGSVETVFNADMNARPRVPITRVDLSGYGGSNFSDWNNPFAAFAEAAKVQFQLIVGRTSLEVIKVNSVLHPWGIRVTRSVTIERRPGGGVIRRDSGWQAFTPGIFDYRYFDLDVGASGEIVVADYNFDAGVFRGLFNVRTIRPAPGTVFAHGDATLVPYYFDADVAIEGVPERTPAIGILGYLQTAPHGMPARADAIQALIETQGPIGGPIDTWMNFGGSELPFRAQRVEVGLAIDSGNPLFVATVRGIPSLPITGAWSVVTRPVASVPPNGGEAVPVAENRGVPVIRRYPVRYLPGDNTVFQEPRLDGTPGDYRFADAADLLKPSMPDNDYALLQSTPTHAFLFPRPFVRASSPTRIESGDKPALADIFARSTSKGSFPPTGNTIEMATGSLHFKVSPDGKLALSAPISIVGHPTPLQLGGTPGHGTSLFYDTSTISLKLDNDRWEAEFTGLRLWSDILGLERLTGSEIRVVGSTDQRPQIAEIRTLMLQEIEDILRFIPFIGDRGIQGPIDLSASNSKHEFKVETELGVPIPKVEIPLPAGASLKLWLYMKASTGFDRATGGTKVSAAFGIRIEEVKVPIYSVGAVAVFLIVNGKIEFGLTSVSGAVTAETLTLQALAGVGVEGRIGPFKAYCYLGIGIVLTYDIANDVTKYGGLVALEAGVSIWVVKVKIRAELKGLVYDDAGTTKCDYTGSVKVQVEITIFFSISASYQISDTKSF